MCKHGRMTRRVRSAFKALPPKNFIAEWREHRGYNQADLQDRLWTMFEAEASVASISHWESGKQPIDTGMLQLIAEALSTSAYSLMSRPPGVEAGVMEVWDRIPEEKRGQAMAVLETFAKAANG